MMENSTLADAKYITEPAPSLIKMFTDYKSRRNELLSYKGIMERNLLDHLEYLRNKHATLFKTEEEHQNLINMIKSEDIEDGMLAIEIIDTRLKQIKAENGIKV